MPSETSVGGKRQGGNVWGTICVSFSNCDNSLKIKYRVKSDLIHIAMFFFSFIAGQAALPTEEKEDWKSG